MTQVEHARVVYAPAAFKECASGQVPSHMACGIAS